MPVRLVTAPAVEPVTLAEAKQQLRLESTDDDAVVGSLIVVARQQVEQDCWRGLMTQTYELVTERFPDGLDAGASDGRIDLPWGQLVSIAAVKYVDTNGVEQTMDAGDYSADTVSVPGRIHLAFGKSWPSARAQWDAVKVRYVVGWATASDVPAALKHAIKLLVSQLYEFRSLQIDRALAEVQGSYDALIAPYRLVRFA